MTPVPVSGKLTELLERRFGESVSVPRGMDGLDRLAALAGRVSCRSFSDRPVAPEIVRLVSACALTAATKSDLQQRDIIIVTDPEIRAKIDAVLTRNTWMRAAPVLLVVCANGRRIGQIAEWHGRAFPNDHLDLLVNAVGDAALALGMFMAAADSVGLGSCPVSEVRDHAEDISQWLGLPDKVIPFAGLCLGWPDKVPELSARLPLPLTLHENRYKDADKTVIEAYDERRAHAEGSGKRWSNTRSAQYSEPQRADFGAYAASKGFRLR